MAGFNLEDFIDPEYGHLKVGQPQQTEQPAADSSSSSSNNNNKNNTIGDMATAASTGFLQEATAGFGDEIAGGVGAVVDLFTGQDKIIENGKEREASLVELYRRNKGDFKAISDAAAAKNPGIATAAGLTGAILSPVNKLGGLAAKGISSTLGKVAVSGATTGAVAGLGYSDADNVKDIAIDSLKGAGLGGALAGSIQGAGGLIAKAAPKLADSVRKSIAKASAKDVEQDGLRIARGGESREDKILSLGKELGLYSGGRKTMLEATTSAQKAKLDLVESTIAEANKTVDRVALKGALEKSKEKLIEKVKDNLALNGIEKKRIIKDLSNRVDDFASKVDSEGLDVIHNAKKAITQKLNDKVYLMGGKPTPKAAAQKELAGELKTIVEDFTPGNTVKKANEDWGLLNDIAKRVSKQDEKTVIGSFAPFLGIATGTAAAPASLFAFNNFKRQVGARNLTAKVLDKIGKVAGHSSERAGLFTRAASKRLNDNNSNLTADGEGVDGEEVRNNEKDYFNGK